MKHLLLAVVCFMASCAWSAPADESGFEWEVDLGLLVHHEKPLIESLSKNNDLQAIVLLTGGMYYDNFFIEAAPLAGRELTFGYTLSQSDGLQVNLIAESVFLEISEEEQQSGNLLDGIKKRRPSTEVGIELLKSNRSVEWQLRILHDALNRHQGTVIEAKIAYPIFTRTTLIVPALGLTYADSNAINYYFGIDADEVTSSRPMYSASGAWVGTARTYIEHPMSDTWSIVGSAVFSYFDDEISDSPIVTRNDVLALNIGVLWSF